MNTFRRWSGHVLLALVVALAGATSMLLLVRSGQGSLQLPTDRSLDGLRAWAAERDPITIAMALLRLAALGLAAQLGLATTCSAFGVALRLPSLVRAADLMSLPGTRTLVRQGTMLVLSAASLVEGPAGARPTPATPSTVTLERVAPTGDQPGGVAAMRRMPQSTSTALLTRMASSSATTVTLDRVEPPHPGPARASTTPPAPVPARPRSSPPTTWEVRAGDHLWSIAEATLADAWGRPPTHHEVHRYWRQVVRANRWLADPDVVRPGQAVALPPVQSAHA